MAAVTPIKVLMPIFSGFNTLDLNGPLEVLARPKEKGTFKCTIAAAEDVTLAAEGVSIQRHISLEEALETYYTYDILLVPGGEAAPVLSQAAQTSSAFMQLILAYSELTGSTTTDRHHPHPPPKKPILLSICTGAGFLGQLGILDGIKCTTHFGFLDTLRSICVKVAEESGKKAGKVIRARFVDAGTNGNGVRIITGGGISCGLDSALYVVRMLKGDEVAWYCAGLMEYASRVNEGVIVEDE
ncbi:DJ-1 domain, InhA-type [Lasallia pustulata]|uniref:DJ-1 domain, InhA-type n=1 Tax=Lasallia pustulata TaxID=136370 RepID=A0A1W5CX33_9LECA|nr:DJ-1 domain, InhA-type [Lasallia pustulata]